MQQKTKQSPFSGWRSPQLPTRSILTPHHEPLPPPILNFHTHTILKFKNENEVSMRKEKKIEPLIIQGVMAFIFQ